MANLYRKGVGIMLINTDYKVFMGQRFDSQFDAWQMPQGGIDDGETEEQAMHRELAEEVGTSSVSVLAKSKRMLSYDLPSELIPSFWGGKFVGQQQRWFLCKLEGGDELINIETAHPEFKSYRWADLSEIVDLIVPFKKQLYRDIISEFEIFFPKAKNLDYYQHNSD